jgi:hypothetical protein
MGKSNSNPINCMFRVSAENMFGRKMLNYVANVAIMHILQKRKHIIDGDLQK